MFKIGKEFSFCYGHRVHNQSLNPELSLDSCLACRHFHGHQGTILVFLEPLDSESLNAGMVTDFKHLNWFKKWLDDVLDHKMILDINDPALKSFYPILNWIDFPINPDAVDALLEYHQEGYFAIKPDQYSNLPNYEQEIYEGLVLVPFVPTSENLSKWLWEILNKKMGHLCKISQVQFFETPKSQSNYFSK